MMTVPIVIAFEASGFGRGSYPVEVGFSQRHGEGWCSLIRPEHDWNLWDEIAAGLHQIPREILVANGNPVRMVAEQLNAMLDGYTVYTDGWVHDYILMARLFEAAACSPNFRLADLREIISPQQESMWQATKIQVEDELNLERHRASNEARILQLTWLRTFDACRILH